MEQQAEQQQSDAEHGANQSKTLPDVAPWRRSHGLGYHYATSGGGKASLADVFAASRFSTGSSGNRSSSLVSVTAQSCRRSTARRPAAPSSGWRPDNTSMMRSIVC